MIFKVIVKLGVARSSAGLDLALDRRERQKRNGRIIGRRTARVALAHLFLVGEKLVLVRFELLARQIQMVVDDGVGSDLSDPLAALPAAGAGAA